jgi:hypothetical protein
VDKGYGTGDIAAGGCIGIQRSLFLPNLMEQCGEKSAPAIVRV